MARKAKAERRATKGHVKERLKLAAMALAAFGCPCPDGSPREEQAWFQRHTFECPNAPFAGALG